MIHRRRKTDANQKIIVAGLRAIGTCVIDLSASGCGVMDLLALHPRGAQVVINGQATPCVFWGVSSYPDNTIREAIDAAMQEGAKEDKPKHTNGGW